jgi:hypothetical protein
LATSRSRLRTGRRRGFRSASFSPLLGSNPFPTESTQSAFGDFQLIELIAQLCPFRIEPHEPFGNPLFVLSDLVQHSHLLVLLSLPYDCRARVPVLPDESKISPPKQA